MSLAPPLLRRGHLSRDMKGEMRASAPRAEDTLSAKAWGCSKPDGLEEQQEGWCSWSIPNKWGWGGGRGCSQGRGLRGSLRMKRRLHPSLDGSCGALQAGKLYGLI